MNDADCLFCKFVSGELNADVVYETDKVFAFRDINPQAPTHVLIIPRKHIATINDLTDSDREEIGNLYLAAKEVAQEVAAGSWVISDQIEATTASNPEALLTRLLARRQGRA